MAAKPKNHEDHLTEVHRETKVINGEDFSVRYFKNIKTGEVISRTEPLRSATDHWLIVGNAANILPDIPSDSIDLIVTSPPYYGSKFFANLFPTLDIWENLIRTVARESMRILQD